MAADADDVLLHEIAARLDLMLVHVRAVRGVVVHEDEAALFGTEDEIGVMRRGLVVVDDDVRTAVAADDVAPHTNGKGLAARGAVQTDEPADDIAFLLLADFDALRGDSALDRRSRHRRGGAGVTAGARRHRHRARLRYRGKCARLR